MIDEALIPDVESRPRCEGCGQPKVCEEKCIRDQSIRSNVLPYVRWILNGRPLGGRERQCLARKQFYVCPDRHCPGWARDQRAIETWRQQTDPHRTYTTHSVDRAVEQRVQRIHEQQQSSAPSAADFREHSPPPSERSPQQRAALRDVNNYIHDRVRDLERLQYDDCHNHEKNSGGCQTPRDESELGVGPAKYDSVEQQPRFGDAAVIVFLGGVAGIVALEIINWNALEFIKWELPVLPVSFSTLTMGQPLTMGLFWLLLFFLITTLSFQKAFSSRGDK